MKQQHESDLNDPKQRFPWAFRGIEVNGVPVAFPEPILEGFSEHLSRAGYLHISQVAELLASHEYGAGLLAQLPQQEIHYQPPIRGQDHAMNTSGAWVPVSQPIQRPVVPTVSLMTDQEKAKMLAEFKEEGLID